MRECIWIRRMIVRATLGVWWMMVAAAVVAMAGLTVVLAHDSPAPGGTEHHVHDLDLPRNELAAQLAGYTVPKECVPGMGRHAVKVVNGVIQQPILLYNYFGYLIGIEFITRLYPDDPAVLLADFGIDLDDPSTWPVPVPPWEGPMGPHPGLPEGTLHWDVHVYIGIKDLAEKACG